MEAARQGVRLWYDNGSKGAGLIHGADFAEALVAGGALDEAQEVLERHRELADSAAADHRRAQNLRVEGLLEERRGRTDRALERLDRAIAMFEDCGSEMLLRRARVDRERLTGSASSS